MVEPPRYSDSIEKLVNDLRATYGSSSQQFDIAKAILDVKLQHQAVEQAKRNADQARGLKIATWALVVVTIVLAISTAGLIIATLRV